MEEYNDWLEEKVKRGGFKDQIMRTQLGHYGVSGNIQTIPIGLLSDGQKSRVVFAHLGLKNPHLLLLDEPTNHLDMDTIDALAEAVNNFNGGMILVSHDMRLIKQVCDELYECKNKGIFK